MYKENHTAELAGSLQALIEQKIQAYLLQTFGYNALLFSPLAKKLCNDQLLINHQIVISPKFSAQHIDVQCHYEALPIASDSIDFAFLPAILQQSNEPHQVIREVERVLIPEGCLILVGRKPFSWHGLKKKILNRAKRSKHKTFDISTGRLADWFQLLDLQIEEEVHLSSVLHQLQTSQLPNWLKKTGVFFCNYFASYYIILAKKKVSRLTPIRPSWRKNKQVASPRLAEPSVKGQVENWFERFK